ncbi:Uu.00g052930.m01.CDS01 [Anthostomella pinea]|uniref:Uu.00g052930.m01.CDS01 n=1 Tax=Anthostomella pinea TaxID=933095 RepID=A0AAI8VWD8_9PEZI|nr:Uu.00g052930.m01.CDS01 [Anthostomella pinea]
MIPLRANKSIRGWLVALVRTTKPSATDTARMVTEAYEQVVYPRSALKSEKQVLTFLNDWERVMADATYHNIPHVIEPMFWIKDFAVAIQGYAPTFADRLYLDYVYNHMGAPDYLEISRRFQAWIALQAAGSRAGARRIQRGTALQAEQPQFAGDRSPSTEDFPADPASNQRQQSRKRGQADTGSGGHPNQKPRPPTRKAIQVFGKKIKENLDFVKEVMKLRDEHFAKMANEQQAGDQHQKFEDRAYSSILDSGSTLHVFNDLSQFESFRKAPRGHFVVAGNSEIPILGYGECADFACNIISYDLLKKRGYYWDTRKNTINRKDGSILGELSKIYGQRIVEYNPSPIYEAAFPAAARRLRRRTTATRPNFKGTALQWHLRMGHIGPEPLRQLGLQCRGTSLRGPQTHEYEECARAKAYELPSRRNPDLKATKAFYHMNIYWEEVKEGYNGVTRIMTAVCKATGLAIPYFCYGKTTEENVANVQDLINFAKRHQFEICIIRADNEFFTAMMEDLLYKEGIIPEPSAPHTQAQTGRAEKQGHVGVQKARAMKGKLPYNLWPVIVDAAFYLYNCTPRAISK